MPCSFRACKKALKFMDTNCYEGEEGCKIESHCKLIVQIEALFFGNESTEDEVALAFLRKHFPNGRCSKNINVASMTVKEKKTPARPKNPDKPIRVREKSEGDPAWKKRCLYCGKKLVKIGLAAQKRAKYCDLFCSSNANKKYRNVRAGNPQSKRYKKDNPSPKNLPP